MGWSCMNWVWWSEQGRRVNWVTCDTFYSDELLIRHIERAIWKYICMQTCRLVF